MLCRNNFSCLESVNKAMDAPYLLKATLLISRDLLFVIETSYEFSVHPYISSKKTEQQSRVRPQQTTTLSYVEA
jgi:hypothetical protein